MTQSQDPGNRRRHPCPPGVGRIIRLSRDPDRFFVAAEFLP